MLWIMLSKYHNYQNKPQPWQVCTWEGHTVCLSMKPQQALLQHRENSHQKGEVSCCRAGKASEELAWLAWLTAKLPLTGRKSSSASPQQVLVCRNLTLQTHILLCHTAKFFCLVWAELHFAQQKIFVIFVGKIARFFSLIIRPLVSKWIHCLPRVKLKR